MDGTIGEALKNTARLDNHTNAGDGFGRDMLIFAIRLHQTSPENFGPSWNEFKLLRNIMTVAWRAAYELLGSKWRLKKGPDNKTRDNTNLKPAPTSTPTGKTNSQSQAITQTTKNLASKPKVQTHKTKTGMFVVKQSPQNQSPVNQLKDRAERKYTTILKMATPSIKADREEGNREVITLFQNVLDILRTADAALVLTPVDYKLGQTNTSIPTKDWSKIKNKKQLLLYTDKCFIKAGQQTWMQFQVGHNVEREVLLKESILQKVEDKLIYLAPTPLQSMHPRIVGWLVGSTPRTNLNDLKEALENHPVMKIRNIEVECRVMEIKIKDRAEKNGVKAVHILVDKQKLYEARGALSYIYGSRNTQGLPQGKQMKFMLYTVAGPGQPPSGHDLKNLAKKGLEKQRGYLEETVQIESGDIAGIDIYIGHGIDATLRQVVMCMKAPDGATNLFSAVETTQSGSVLFFTHLTLYDQAQPMVEFLHLILEARFNQHIWGWFTDESKAATAGQYWDKEAGMACTKGIEEARANLAQFGNSMGFEHMAEYDDFLPTAEPISLDIQIDLNGDKDALPSYNYNSASIGTLGPFAPLLEEAASLKSTSETNPKGGMNTNPSDHSTANDSPHDDTDSLATPMDESPDEATFSTPTRKQNDSRYQENMEEENAMTNTTFDNGSTMSPPNPHFHNQDDTTISSMTLAGLEPGTQNEYYYNAGGRYQE